MSQRSWACCIWSPETQPLLERLAAARLKTGVQHDAYQCFHLHDPCSPTVIQVPHRSSPLGILRPSFLHWVSWHVARAEDASSVPNQYGSPEVEL